MDRNPALRPGLDALVGFLIDKDYTAHAVAHILGHVGATGCLATAEYLDREDEEAATEAFVEALPGVPYDAEAWARPDVYLDAESILAAAGRRRIPRGVRLVPPELEPEDGPTAADLAEYGHYLEALDRDSSPPW
jgi:hypothetical protein